MVQVLNFLQLCNVEFYTWNDDENEQVEIKTMP